MIELVRVDMVGVRIERSLARSKLQMRSWVCSDIYVLEACGLCGRGVADMYGIMERERMREVGEASSSPQNLAKYVHASPTAYSTAPLPQLVVVNCRLRLGTSISVIWPLRMPLFDTLAPHNRATHCEVFDLLKVGVACDMSPYRKNRMLY